MAGSMRVCGDACLPVDLMHVCVTYVASEVCVSACLCRCVCLPACLAGLMHTCVSVVSVWPSVFVCRALSVHTYISYLYIGR